MTFCLMRSVEDIYWMSYMVCAMQCNHQTVQSFTGCCCLAILL